MTHQQAVESLAAERYLLDEMPEIERYSFEEHFFACEACAESMRLGHRLRRDASDVFEPGSLRQERGTTDAAAPRWPSWRTAMPWAAAAVLAIALVVQGQRLGPPGTDEMTRAYTPVTLRPASRGAITTVTPPASGESLALALDVNIGAPGSPIAYTLSRDGASVASGRATTPAAGVPLLLLVPGDRLAPSGSYVLSLSAPDQPSVPPAEYRFDTAAR